MLGFYYHCHLCEAECVCVCMCVCTWWNQPQVSTFLLLDCISFAFFSRPDCWLPALVPAWPLNFHFFSSVSEPCLEKSADCPPVLQMPLTPLLPSKEGMPAPAFELRSKEEVSAVIWGILPGISERALSENLPLICWVILHQSLPISGP